MEHVSRATQSHRILTVLAFAVIAGISLQMLGSAMSRYWWEVAKSYTVATSKAEAYRALGGKAIVVRSDRGLYDVMYEPILSQPIDLHDGTMILKMTFDPPIPPDP